MSFLNLLVIGGLKKNMKKKKKEFIFKMNKACKQINKLTGNKIKPNTEISFQYFYGLKL